MGRHLALIYQLPRLRCGGVPGACGSASPIPARGLLNAAGPGAGAAAGGCRPRRRLAGSSTLRFVLGRFLGPFPKGSFEAPVTTTQHSLSVQECPAEAVVLEEPVPSGDEWKRPARPNIERRCGALGRAGSGVWEGSASDSGSQGTASGLWPELGLQPRLDQVQPGRAPFPHRPAAGAAGCGAGLACCRPRALAPADRGVMRRMGAGHGPVGGGPRGASGGAASLAPAPGGRVVLHTEAAPSRWPLCPLPPETHRAGRSVTGTHACSPCTPAAHGHSPWMYSTPPGEPH